MFFLVISVLSACNDPGMDELSQKGLLQDIPSAQEIREQYQEKKDLPPQSTYNPQSTSTSGIDIPFLKGKAIDQAKGMLTQQLGPLQEVIPLANPEEEIRRYETGEISLSENNIYRVKVILPEPMRHCEALMYVVGDGSDRPYRWKIKSPMFTTISACPHYLKGYKVADIPAIMGSIDICIGETDK